MMLRDVPRAIVLVGALTLAVPHPSFAQAVPMADPATAGRPPIMAPRVVPPLDQEMWAGVSYRQALFGVVVLGGSAALVTWLTSSAISGITAAVSLAAAYVVYDPGVTGVMSPNDLPTLRDLSVNGSAQSDK